MQRIRAASEASGSNSALVGHILRADLGSQAPFRRALDASAALGVIRDIQVGTSTEIAAILTRLFRPRYNRASSMRSSVVANAGERGGVGVAMSLETLRKRARPRVSALVRSRSLK